MNKEIGVAHFQKQYFKGFGYARLTMFIKQESKNLQQVKGITFFAFHKKIISFVLSDHEWIDDHGVSYKIKYLDHVLFVHKLAIGIFPNA